MAGDIQGQIVIYTIPDCPDCSAAEDCLSKHNLDFLEISVDEQEREELFLKTKTNKYPQIFFNEEFIGSYSQLLALINNEEQWNQFLNKFNLSPSHEESSSIVHKKRSEIRLKVKRFRKHKSFLEKVYYTTDCTDFELIKDCFSSEFKGELNENNVFEIHSGRLTDIIVWSIIHSTKTKKRNEDTASFLLCFHWICSPLQLYKVIKGQWKKWKADGFPKNIQRKDMVERLKNFAYHYLESPVSHVNYKEELIARLKLKDFVITKKRSYEEFLCKAIIPKNLEVIVPCDILSPRIEFPIDETIENCEFSVEELANQLTIDEAEMYRKINIIEFMDQNWESPEKGPAVCKLVSKYNKISRWVSYSILDTQNTKDIITSYQKFVNLACRLHELQNYNSCTAILGGLSDASIARLKKISNNLSEEYSKKISNLKDIYSPIDGYKKYRQLPTYPVCIPALAVYLRDLSLSLDGNQIYEDERQAIINFERMRLVADRVIELHHIDTSKYFTDIENNIKVKQYLYQIDPPSIDGLYELSLNIEPPRSKKTEAEQIAELRLENQKLKSEVVHLVTEKTSRLKAQQHILEKVQHSNENQSSVTISNLLDSITNGTPTTKEQALLLKLQIQGALNLCVSLTELTNTK